MPTYDYECGACNRHFEIFHSITETRKKCPKCGQSKLVRLIGPGSGFLFRGSGFYITDYRSPDYSSKAKAESSSSSSKSASADTSKSPAKEKAPSKG